MVDNLIDNQKQDNQEKIKVETQEMSNEINTIVNREINKDKQEVVNTDIIHVMPKKFLPESPKKQLGNKQKIVLVAVAFILFLIIVVGIMLWIAGRSIPSLPEVDLNQPAVNNETEVNNTEPTISHDEKIVNDLNIISSSLSKYFADFRTYPELLSDLSRYLDTIPRQADNSAYQYQLLANGNDFRIVVEFDNSSSANRVGLYQLTKSGLVAYDPTQVEDEDNIINPPPVSPTSTSPLPPPPPPVSPTSTSPLPPPPPTQDNLDLDSDNLTVTEEAIYSTDPDDNDSDNDGYLDGSEIINLYNPLASADPLINSGLVTIFRNNDFNYSIFRPKNWVAQALDEELTEVVFLPDSETGEFISILIFDNPDSLTLTQWSEQVDSTSTWTNFSLGKTQQLSALQTTDGLQVLFINNSHVYLLSYHYDEGTSLNFTTTFEMMLNSFELTND